MSAVSYGTRQGVYGCGVPRGALVPQSRLVLGVDPVGHTVELSGHGFSAGDSVEFTSSGMGVLPSPLAALTIYYVLLIALADGTTDENRFQVSATLNGSPVALSSAGTPPFSAVQAIGPTIDKFLEIYSRWADSCLPAHAAPLAQPYPAWVVNIVNIRTASKVLSILGRSAPQFQQREQTEIVDFLRLAKGIPLRGDASAQLPTNTAVVANAAIGSTASPTSRGSIP